MSKIDIQVAFEDDSILGSDRGNCWPVDVIPKAGEWVMVENVEYPILRVVHELDHLQGSNVILIVGRPS